MDLGLISREYTSIWPKYGKLMFSTDITDGFEWTCGQDKSTEEVEISELGYGEEEQTKGLTYTTPVMSFPDKTSREKCWKSRDILWDCLNTSESAGKDPNSCSELRALYIAACPAQWVKHFDRRREYLKFKAKIENDGYEPVSDLK